MAQTNHATKNIQSRVSAAGRGEPRCLWCNAVQVLMYSSAEGIALTSRFQERPRERKVFSSPFNACESSAKVGEIGMASSFPTSHCSLLTQQRPDSWRKTAPDNKVGLINTDYAYAIHRGKPATRASGISGDRVVVRATSAMALRGCWGPMSVPAACRHRWHSSVHRTGRWTVLPGSAEPLDHFDEVFSCRRTGRYCNLPCAWYGCLVGIQAMATSALTHGCRGPKKASLFSSAELQRWPI